MCTHAACACLTLPKLFLSHQVTASGWTVFFFFFSSAGIISLPPAHPTSHNHIYSLIKILINLLTKITEYNSTGNRANHTAYLASGHQSLLLKAVRPPRPKLLLKAVRPPQPKLLLKAGRPPRPKLSCSRQADLHSLISHLHCAVRPTASYVARIPWMANQITLCAIRGVIHVPLGPNPFYYSLLGKMKLMDCESLYWMQCAPPCRPCGQSSVIALIVGGSRQ